MCAFSGTTGRIQTSKICALPRDVRVGEELEHAARERLDVGVVAVVHAAHLADPLVEVRPVDERCSPSQARATRERGEVGMRARDLDREAEGDRGRARLLLDDLDLDARRASADDARRRGERRSRRAACASSASSARDQLVGHVAADADASGSPACRPASTKAFTSSSVMASMPGDRAERRVAVGRAGEDVRLQPLLAELLLVVRCAGPASSAFSCCVLQPLEVLVAEAGLERAAAARSSRKRCQLSRWMTPVNVVISLSTCASKLAGHREERLLDLVDASSPSSRPRRSSRPSARRALPCPPGRARSRP